MQNFIKKKFKVLCHVFKRTPIDDLIDAQYYSRARVTSFLPHPVARGQEKQHLMIQIIDTIILVSLLSEFA